MRIAATEAVFEEQLESAKREAMKSFGDEVSQCVTLMLLKLFSISFVYCVEVMEIYSLENSAAQMMSIPGDADREIRGDTAPHRGPGVWRPARQLRLSL